MYHETNVAEPEMTALVDVILWLVYDWYGKVNTISEVPPILSFTRFRTTPPTLPFHHTNGLRGCTYVLSHTFKLSTQVIFV